MSYNIFNKKQWLLELENVTSTYIDLIDKISDNKTDIELDLILNKKYKSGGFTFTGQEIIDNIRKKLQGNMNYIYEFRTKDNKPIIKKDYRIFSDDKMFAKVNDISFTDRTGKEHKIKNDNIIVTIEDLKSKYIESLAEIDKLKEEIETKEETNYNLFLEIVEATGGLYQFVSKKKMILMLSRILKEFGFYLNEKGTQYSYEELTPENKTKVLELYYKKVYK